MLELLAIALFQIASLTGVSTLEPTAGTPVAADGGTGGWGHDVVAPAPTTGGSTYSLDGGTGGWGHD